MPKLAALPNGPYYLYESTEVTPVAHLQRQSGARLSTARGVALCRCGGSKNKPFCDGTHSTNGFSSDNTAKSTDSTRVAFEGKHITIYDNRAICSHAGICTDNLKSVFLYGKEPWIDPDGATAQEIMAVIGRCPSGALSCSVEELAPVREPMVTVTDNGPYAVSGGIELMNVEFGDGASKEHYTLCRCGASRNKPFCDGSHWAVGFKDP